MNLNFKKVTLFLRSLLPAPMMDEFVDVDMVAGGLVHFCLSEPPPEQESTNSANNPIERIAAINFFIFPYWLITISKQRLNI